MRCSCRNCGEYMIQDEHGIESCCICPICFTKCSLCINDRNQPLDREALYSLLKKRESMDLDSQNNYED